MRLRERLRDARNRRDFRSTKAGAASAGLMVCGTYGKDGKPIYFQMPAGADEAAIAARAFELREGRPESPAEQAFKGYAESFMARHKDRLGTK